MNDPNFLDCLRDELADAVAAHTAAPASPLDISPYVAMSLLQKAIRRGREDLALQAAATLLRDAPDRLWRRLGIIAVEDIGLADLHTAGIVTAALVGKTFRSHIGGEWAVASHLVSRMCNAPQVSRRR